VEEAKARRKIREVEVEEAKARRKAEKKARKSGVFVATDSPVGIDRIKTPEKGAGQDTTTPAKRPDLKGLKADEKTSASPKFSFSPRASGSSTNEFAATMARLKAAEKQRLEDEIRRQEAEMPL